MAFLAVDPSFFDALVMKLFRFDVWIDSYKADIFVDRKVIPEFSPGSLSNTWRPLNKAEITRFSAVLTFMILKRLVMKVCRSVDS